MAMDVVSLRNLLSPLVGEKITYIKLLDKSYYLNYILRLVGNDSITIYGEGSSTLDNNGRLSFLSLPSHTSVSLAIARKKSPTNSSLAIPKPRNPRGFYLLALFWRIC